MLNTNAVMGMI